MGAGWLAGSWARLSSGWVRGLLVATCVAFIRTRRPSGERPIATNSDDKREEPASLAHWLARFLASLRLGCAQK